MSNLQSKDEFRLRCYSKDQIPSIWDKAKPLVESALNRGSNYTIEQVYSGLCRGEMQLWMWDFEAALVTSIQVKKGKKFCLLLVLAGKHMSTWFQYLPIVEEWARNEGAEEVRVYGRVGWSRMTGYKIDYARMSKQL